MSDTLILTTTDVHGGQVEARPSMIHDGFVITRTGTDGVDTYISINDASAIRLRDALIERYPLTLEELDAAEYVTRQGMTFEAPEAERLDVLTDKVDDLDARVAKLEDRLSPPETSAAEDKCPCGCDRDEKPPVFTVSGEVDVFTAVTCPAPLFRKGERVRVLDAKGATDEIEPGAIGYVAEDYYDGNDDLMMVRLDVSDARVLRKDDYPLGFYADRFGADDTLQPGDRVMVDYAPGSGWNGPGTVTEAPSTHPAGIYTVKTDRGLSGGFDRREIAPLRPSGV